MKYPIFLIIVFITFKSFSQSNSYFKFFNNGSLKFEFVGKLFEKKDSILLFSTAQILSQGKNSAIRLRSSSYNNNDYNITFQSNVIPNRTYSINDGINFNNNYYFTGTIDSGAGLESYDIFVSKFTQNFLLDPKIIGDTDKFESAKTMTFDFEGNLVISGLSRKEFTTNVNESIVAKLDSNLNLIWKKNISTEFGHIESFAAACDNENNVYLFAKQHSISSMTQAVLIKLNRNGNLLWTKYYPGGASIPEDLLFNKKGKLIGSVTADYDGFGRNFTLMEIDTSGKVNWTRSYLSELGNAVFANKIVELKNGGYAVCLNNGYPVLLVVDENGEPDYIRHFSGLGVEDVKDILELSDGSFAITGNYLNLVDPSDQNTMWLIKTNEKGELVSSNNDDGLPQMQIYPNPTNGILNIENMAYEILHVLNEKGTYIESFMQHQNIDISNYPKGNYFIIINTQHFQNVARIVKL